MKSSQEADASQETDAGQEAEVKIKMKTRQETEEFKILEGPDARKHRG